MKRVIKITSFCVLVFLASNIALGQRRTIKRPASKSAASLQRSICKGESVPSGFVVIGYKSSSNCGENSELIIKKPTNTEIVCDGSPIPDGYHVVSQQGSMACASVSSNPLTNALNIARDDSASTSSTSTSNYEDYHERPARRTSVVVSLGGGREEDEQPKSVLQQRADEEQRKAKLQLAVINHKIIVGMTTDQVLESWGRPSDADAMTSSGSGTSRTWIYSKNGESVHLYFKNGILQDWTWFH
jgi:hypothetical protein